MRSSFFLLFFLLCHLGFSGEKAFLEEVAFSKKTPSFLVARRGWFESVRTRLQKTVRKAVPSILKKGSVHKAIKKRDIEDLDRRLKEGEDPNLKDELGGAALHLIASSSKKNESQSEKDLTAIRILLRSGADINIKNNEGETPLFVAVSSLRFDVAELLLEKDASVHITNKEERNIFHIITSNPMYFKEENLPFLRRLLEKGVDVNSMDAQGRTPIHEAIHKGGVEAVDFLIKEARIDLTRPDNEGKTPVAKVLELVLEENAYEKGVEILEAFQKNGMDINMTVDSEGLRIIHVAALSGRENFIDLLLEKGADIEARDALGLTPFLLVSSRGMKENVKLLLKKGVDIMAEDFLGKTASQVAEQFGHKKIARHLNHLEEKAMIAHRDLQNKKKGAVVDLEKEILNSTNEKGLSLLHVAAINGLSGSVRALARQGVLMNVREKGRGLTPLHAAIYSYIQSGKNLEVIIVLLKNGADVDVATIKGGWAPLHIAAFAGKMELVEVLFRAGADLTLKNSEEMNAYQLARSREHHEVADFLEKHGAK